MKTILTFLLCTFSLSIYAQNPLEISNQSSCDLLFKIYVVDLSTQNPCDIPILFQSVYLQGGNNSWGDVIPNPFSLAYVEIDNCKEVEPIAPPLSCNFPCTVNYDYPTEVVFDGDIFCCDNDIMVSFENNSCDWIKAVND